MVKKKNVIPNLLSIQNQGQELIRLCPKMVFIKLLIFFTFPGLFHWEDIYEHLTQSYHLTIEEIEDQKGDDFLVRA